MASIETFSETHAAAAEKFFARFGMAIFAACQLQYRLAHLYGVTFDSSRDGCLPRVNEKIFEGLKSTFGTAVQLAKQSAVLTGGLLIELEIAHILRDYIVHRLFIETRSQQGSEQGFEGLSSRLEVARDFFLHVNKQLENKHAQIFIDAGVPQELYDTHRKAWDEMEDEEIAPSVPLPRAWETIRTAWLTPGPMGTTIVLESDQGTFWQLVDNGLAYCPERPSSTWAVHREIQQHLPAKVKARPSRESTPPEYRRAFDYDLRFDSGAVFRLERLNATTLQYSIAPPRGGRKKRRRK